jgi:hypothetical protein
VLDEARLLEFPKLVDNSFENVMKQASLSILTRARIWALAPETLRRATYDSLSETLKAQASDAGLDPSRAFPAPEPLERIGNESEGDASTGSSEEPSDREK